MKNETIKFRIKESIYTREIDCLEVGARATNSMKRAGFFTIEDVIDNVQKLKNTRGCGEKTVREILNKIINLAIQEGCEAYGE